MKPLKKNFKAGMHLFRENDRSRELYIVETGRIKIYRTVCGKEIELAVLDKGSVVGEMALIDGKPRSASARALDECSVIMIDSETFHARARGVPAWFISIIGMTCQKIRQANRRLQSTSRERQGVHIVITLFLYFQRFGAHGNPIPLTALHENLTELLGVTVRQVSRVIDFLGRNGFIRIEHDRVRIADTARLREYCEYLRHLIRKQFDFAEKPSARIQSLALVLIPQYPDFLRSEAGTTVIEGDRFYGLLESNDLQDHHLDLLDALTHSGLCTVSRKTRAPASQPLGDLSLKFPHAAWKRIYLFGKYSPLDPGV